MKVTGRRWPGPSTNRRRSQAQDVDPDLILILAGDHVYKMDYRKMIDYHNMYEADVTVAYVPMPKETSKDFGVIEVGGDSSVLGFQEKPNNPKVMPDEPNSISASMGIYLFNKTALLNELEEDATHSSAKSRLRNG